MAYNLPSMTVTVRSFAKINLGLRIGAPRADGFHELLTVYQTIALHDVLRISVGRGTGIRIQCDDPRVPRDESNTCFRIVEKAMQALRARGRVLIEIDKRLPVQGGLGGASSNAVSALLGLEQALKKSLSTAERLRIAAEVGSDLPLFLIGGTVLGLGRGEQVYPLEDLPAMACVVITPEVGVSTPKAFAEWDRRWDRLCGAGTPARETLSPAHASGGADGPEAARIRAVGQPRAGIPAWTEKAAELRSARTGKACPELAEGSARPHITSAKLTLSQPSDRMMELGRAYSAWLSKRYSGAPFGRGRAENPLLELVRAGIKNDFEEVVFPEYPELCEGKRVLEHAGAKYASLSGSGSTLYGLFATRQTAVKAAARLRKQGWTAEATTTLTRSRYWRQIFDC
jgi:4-diphosphocytidyl-2-C-methyl-D-erythritol kinase